MCIRDSSDGGRGAEECACPGCSRSRGSTCHTEGGSHREMCIRDRLYEGLYALDTGFTPQPMLAESCTVSGTTCTITLRGGVTFSDGSAVTASDVVRSLQRAQSSERYGARLAGVSRIAAGSGGTVVLTLAYENQNIAALLDIPIVKAGTETATAPIGTVSYTHLSAPAPRAGRASPSRRARRPRDSPPGRRRSSRYRTSRKNTTDGGGTGAEKMCIRDRLPDWAEHAEQTTNEE